MAFNFKRIGSNFLFQSILTILMVISIMLFLFYTSTKKREIIKASIITGELLDKLEESNSLVKHAGSYQIADPKFVSTLADDLISENKELNSEMIDSISTLSEFLFLRSLFKKEHIVDSIQKLMATRLFSYDQYILSLKELGNKDGGSIKKTLESIDAFSSVLQDAPDNGIKNSELLNLRSKFMFDYSEKTVSELIFFSENISEAFYDFSDYDLSTLDQIATQTTENLSNSQSIILRLNNISENTGQYVNLQKSTEQLKLKISNFHDSVIQLASTFTFWLNMLYILVSVIFSIVFLSIMTRLSNKVKHNMKSMEHESSLIASGTIDSSITNNGNYEFITIINNLKKIQHYIRERNDFVHQLLNNNFESNIELQGSKDDLSINLNALKDRLFKEKELQDKQNKINEIRRYNNEGLAKFADIMRINSNNTQILCDNLIKELVKYLGALQGVLFLTEEHDEMTLNLMSAFAYDRKKYIKKTIKKGDGLIGTCAYEKQSINLKEIPKGYVSIKSGLGDTPPNNILLIPVMQDNNLVGVLEIASLKIFDKHDIDLTEQIASNLASTILTVRNSTKTSELLEKSQQQAAEMREQEEEMRQNMEELKATQEESARREDEMQGLINAVGASFYTLEYDTNGKIENINSRLATFLEQSYGSIIGRRHQDIFSDSSIINTEVICEIVASKKVRHLTEVLSWGSKKLIYKHTLSPILTQDGDVMKVLNLLNIEEEQSEQL